MFACRVAVQRPLKPRTHLRAEACHAVGPRATLCQALRQQPGGQAVVGRGQRAVVLQQVARAAALAVVQAGEGRHGGGRGRELCKDQYEELKMLSCGAGATYFTLSFSLSLSGSTRV